MLDLSQLHEACPFRYHKKVELFTPNGISVSREGASFQTDEKADMDIRVNSGPEAFRIRDIAVPRRPRNDQFKDLALQQVELSKGFCK